MPQNDDEAARLYRRAAEQGHLISQQSLGVCYEQCRGILQDNREAALLFGLAAYQGEAQALNLGILCASGRGVSQDDREAARLALFVAGLRFSPAQLWGKLRTWQEWPAGHWRSCSVLPPRNRAG
mmetsp:Transcript_41360/g.102049  ORF Transcript_41360/g.102049 Transcript_41360/m.102049 type:complete len:125 (+) Transcript_41360:168-542(+)